MAEKAVVRAVIAFFFEYDLVDQAAYARIVPRKPWHGHARQPLLQRLEKAHEVPNGKDVVFHEGADVLDLVDATIEFVVAKSVSRVVQGLDEAIQLHRSGAGCLG